jgi:hypothetical protein
MEIHGCVGGGLVRAAAAPHGRSQFVLVRKVHGPGHAKLPLTPAFLLVGNEDGRSDHFDSLD